MNRTKTLGWLVGAAALLFAGCSSENDLAGEATTTEPTAQTATKIHVTVGAGISDGDAATRATVEQTGTTRKLKFTTGDRLYIVRALADGKCLAGELTMTGAPTEDGTQATFEGELRVYDSEGGEATHDFGGEDPLEGSTATLIHAAMSAEAGDYSFNFETRALTFAEATGVAASVEALMTKGLRVSGGYDGSGFALQKATAQPILNCTIAGLTASATFAMAYSVSADGSTYDDITTGSVTADAQGTATFACLATEEFNDGEASHTNIYHRIRLTNNGDGADTYDVSIGQKALQSKVYNLSRRFVNLSSVTTSNSSLTLENGDIVTGTLYGSFKHVKISIADDATVTLDGVDIRGYNSPSYKWAGLTCTGDATIILADGSTNSVTGFYEKYPGIHVAPGHTLTIQGTGSLTATSNGWGAGIGGGVELACGNIDIAGGDITVTGGIYAAGIGSGQDGDCGNITISGTANVTATGGANGAGIGSGGASGNASTCGTITISGTVNVTATGGSNGAGIGSGYANGKASTCGTITISGSASVTAKCGTYSSGIGSGHNGSCSAIVIGSGITQVIAKRNSSSSDLIGKGYEGSCGTVTIDGVVMTADQQNNGVTSNPSDAEHTFEHLTSAVSSNTWTLTKAN